MTNTRNAPTPDASEGVATPPYKTYKTPTIYLYQTHFMAFL